MKTIDLDRPYGANYCRNKGATVASGDILSFMDSDVLVEVDTICRTQLLRHLSVKLG